MTYLMKLMSQGHRNAHAIWQRREARKRLTRNSATVNHGQAAKARQYYSTVRTRLPSTKFNTSRYHQHVAFVPPSNFSFDTNYDETLAFILDFRKIFAQRKNIISNGISGKPYADFAAIDRIDTAAGLVLAAEVHRYAQTFGRPKEIHDNLWNENVRDFFVDSGLFELLKVDLARIRTSASSAPPRKTLKFSCGKTKGGEDARSLIVRLRALAGGDLGPRPTVYTAVAEALANVGHAYPSWFSTWPYRTAKQWWASGFWEPSTSTVGIQLYDQGAGIPLTLPKQTHYPRLLRALDPEASPSGLIKAALQYGRTSTGKEGRGRGLSEMADWIEITRSGFLRIISGAGEVTYRPGRSIIGRNFDAPFCGTLVEWQVQIG